MFRRHLHWCSVSLLAVRNDLLRFLPQAQALIVRGLVRDLAVRRDLHATLGTLHIAGVLLLAVEGLRFLAVGTLRGRLLLLGDADGLRLLQGEPLRLLLDNVLGAVDGGNRLMLRFLGILEGGRGLVLDVL